MKTRFYSISLSNTAIKHSENDYGFLNDPTKSNYMPLSKNIENVLCNNNSNNIRNMKYYDEEDIIDDDDDQPRSNHIIRKFSPNLKGALKSKPKEKTKKIFDGKLSLPKKIDTIIKESTTSLKKILQQSLRLNIASIRDEFRYSGEENIEPESMDSTKNIGKKGVNETTIKAGKIKKQRLKSRTLAFTPSINLKRSKSQNALIEARKASIQIKLKERQNRRVIIKKPLAPYSPTYLSEYCQTERSGSSIFESVLSKVLLSERTKERDFHDFKHGFHSIIDNPYKISSRVETQESENLNSQNNNDMHSTITTKVHSSSEKHFMFPSPSTCSGYGNYGASYNFGLPTSPLLSTTQLNHQTDIPNPLENNSFNQPKSSLCSTISQLPSEINTNANNTLQEEEDSLIRTILNNPLYQYNKVKKTIEDSDEGNSNNDGYGSNNCYEDNYQEDSHNASSNDVNIPTNQSKSMMMKMIKPKPNTYIKDINESNSNYHYHSKFNFTQPNLTSHELTKIHPRRNHTNFDISKYHLMSKKPHIPTLELSFDKLNHLDNIDHHQYNDYDQDSNLSTQTQKQQQQHLTHNLKRRHSSKSPWIVSIGINPTLLPLSTQTNESTSQNDNNTKSYNIFQLGDDNHTDAENTIESQQLQNPMNFEVDHFGNQRMKTNYTRLIQPNHSNNQGNEKLDAFITRIRAETENSQENLHEKNIFKELMNYAANISNTSGQEDQQLIENPMQNITGYFQQNPLGNNNNQVQDHYYYDDDDQITNNFKGSLPRSCLNNHPKQNYKQTNDNDSNNGNSRLIEQYPSNGCVQNYQNWSRLIPFPNNYNHIEDQEILDANPKPLSNLDFDIEEKYQQFEQNHIEDNSYWVNQNANGHFGELKLPKITEISNSNFESEHKTALDLNLANKGYFPHIIEPNEEEEVTDLRIDHNVDNFVIKSHSSSSLNVVDLGFNKIESEDIADNYIEHHQNDNIKNENFIENENEDENKNQNENNSINQVKDITFSA